jgi:hypothetical protein
MPTADAKPNAKRFFKSFLETDEVPLAECLEKANSLERALQRECSSVRPGDILVEVTPVKPGHEKFDLKKMELWNERIKDFVDPSYDLTAADRLLDNSRRVFIFCHPKRSEDCAALNDEQWESVFYEAAKPRPSKRQGQTRRSKRSSKPAQRRS